MFIAPAKIRDYLLSTSHPVGRFKEPFFASLGYAVAHWQRLERDLLVIAASGEAEPGRESQYGQKMRNSWYFNWSLWENCEGIDRLDYTIWQRCAPVCYGLPGRISMKYKLLDTIVLDRDFPEHGLRCGDLGAVVEVYDPDGLEIEFVTASGKTQALVTLNVGDVRPVQDGDPVAVRSVA